MVERNKVSLCADLLAAVFQDNRELLLDLQLKDSLGRYVKERPLLEKLKIGDALEVDASAMPDNDDSAETIIFLLKTVERFMEIFIGAENAHNKVLDPVEKFKRKNQADVERTGIASLLPDFFGLELHGEVFDLSRSEGNEKARHLFLAIFGKYLESDMEGTKRDSLVALLRNCQCITSVADDAAWFEVREDVPVKTVVDQLSGVVESLSVSTRLIEKIFGDYGPLPESLGVLKRLYKGTLSDFTSFGIVDLDPKFRSGLKRDSALLLEGPATVEKEILSYLFLKKGLEECGCVIMVSTFRSPERIRRGLAAAGVDMETVEKNNRLIIVDWHTRHFKRVTGIEEYGTVIKVSNDLTNLAVGIDIAFKKAAGCNSRRLVLDMVSPTIVVEGSERVQEFLDSVKGKMKNANCTSLILLNPKMHPSEEVKVIEDKFDGILSIVRFSEGGRAGSELKLISLSTGPFDTMPVFIDVNERGLAFSTARNDFVSAERISFSHDVAKFPYGISGLESLTAGGLPSGRSFLIWMSPKMAPGDLIKPLVTGASDGNYAIVATLSTIQPQDMCKWLDDAGKNNQMLMEQGMVEIVDWQAQKDSHVLGVEERDGVIMASKDITHLGVGMDLAFRKVSDTSPGMAVLEILSPALRIFDLRTVYPFAQTVNARLEKRGFTSFFILERNAHDSKVNAGMEEIFDGVIDIMDSGDRLELAMLTLRDCHFIPEYRELSVMRGHLAIDITRSLPQREVPKSAEIEMRARLERLNDELKAALEEKVALEQRTGDILKRESELQRRNDELRLHLVDVEKKLNEMHGQTLQGRPAEATQDKVELAKLLKVMDELLEKLPEDVVKRFASSEEFKLYEKILSLYLEEEK
jgi:KaiC/GvpD/RAD55 family RecA-like ATPase